MFMMKSEIRGIVNNEHEVSFLGILLLHFQTNICRGSCRNDLLLVFQTRFIAYAVISEAWQFLAIEWLHGFSFALLMAAMCTYASKVAPGSAIATLISISHTIFWGIGEQSANSTYEARSTRLAKSISSRLHAWSGAWRIGI